MNKKGQIWVETVIYTLIAFAMIGLVLAYAKPKIEEFQDKAIIEQSISMIKDIDSTILHMGGPGNQRILGPTIKKGNLIIDGENDLIYFEIESKHVYSEPGIPISDGNLIIYTQPKGNFNLVNITRDYGEKYNITYQLEDKLKTITESPNPYKLTIINKGGDINVIDMEVK
ncbi:hypothetical protein KAJ87_00325 [Candidatus Pacearchaeota archaeon]|nr:hypothetical protein [Candidatus Pacearchaeota archaeon]